MLNLQRVEFSNKYSLASDSAAITRMMMMSFMMRKQIYK